MIKYDKINQLFINDITKQMIKYDNNNQIIKHGQMIKYGIINQIIKHDMINLSFFKQ